MENQIEFKILNKNQSSEMLTLIKQLNPDKGDVILKQRLARMLKAKSYQCFGIFKEGLLIGLIGCWTLTKLYSGKQLELDNVIIEERFQSKNYGKLFVNFIEDWAIKNSYESIGLNTYIENDRSHKFYFNKGFKIVGFHFQKIII